MAASPDGQLQVSLQRLALHGVVAQLATADGKPVMAGFTASQAEVADVQAQGPLLLPRLAQSAQPESRAWSWAPLAGANGTLRAEIVDAHLLFDADVTVPIVQGQVDFNTATVEHVGPDSRMGVSRLGVYVDAPNGRSYLYQFPSTPVTGVEFERRGALPGPWGADRGRLQLQPFMETLLRQLGGGQGLGVTAQARQLFDRTAVSGELRLGDGHFAAPGLQAELVGRPDGRNAVRIHSESVGRGLTIEIPALWARQVELQVADRRLRCDELTGALTLRVDLEGTGLRFALNIASVKVAGLRVEAAQGR